MPAPEPGQTWAVLGGVFDPVHRGHLNLIKSIVETAGLDGGLLVPALDPPHRSKPPVASFEDRLAMVSVALDDAAKLALSDIEATNPRPSYTITTMRSLRTKYPEVALRFVIGADNVSQLKTWHDWEALLSENRLLVGCRPGSDPSDVYSLPAERIEMVETPEFEVSSTEIRWRIAEGITPAELSKLVPEPVADYIVAKGLYR